MAIYIEAGHNLNDPGAVTSGVKERDLTINFKKDLKYFLEKALSKYSKVKVYFDNDSWTLGQTIANFKKTITSTDVLLSIHFNSATNKKATGSECFISDYASQNSRTLADQLTKANSTVLGVVNRGVKTESESNRGRLGILNMKGVSVLSEPIFMSNPNELENYFRDNGALKSWLAEDYAYYLIEMDKKLNPKDYV